ncbi:MAG: radical SAM protein [Candidatus Omnitrophota bacterium]
MFTGKNDHNNTVIDRMGSLSNDMGNLKHCYSCYYTLWVSPVDERRVMVSTCCKNAFLTKNRRIVSAGICASWNAREFQVQRALTRKGDWSYCWKAGDCFFNPFFQEKEFIGDNPDVGKAILTGGTKLGYFAKKVYIIPSLACNNNCFFCYNGKEGHRGSCYQLSEGILKELREEVVPSAQEIVVSGGEPFFSACAQKLIRWMITDFPEKKLTILTNGTLLQAFGIEKVLRPNIFPVISLYGMCRQTYKNTTGTGYFDAAWGAITQLLACGCENLNLTFIVSRTTAAEAMQFCQFIESEGRLKGVVRNNSADGNKFKGLMRSLETRFARISSRLKFSYCRETFSDKLLQKLYDPYYTTRYFYPTLKVTQKGRSE